MARRVRFQADAATLNELQRGRSMARSNFARKGSWAFVLCCWLVFVWLPAQEMQAQPVPSGLEFLVNESTTGSQLRPSVASTPAGAFVVTWENPADSVDKRFFSASGVAVGGDVEVGGASAGATASPAIDRNADGDIAVAWRRLEASAMSIRMKRFDSSGSAVAMEMEVNVITTGDRSAPAVALSDSGLAMVTWRDDFSGDNEIYGRIYDSAGGSVGPFVVNETTTGEQLMPAVANIEGADRFIVTWAGPDAESNGVYARLVDSTGSPVGADLAANSAAAGAQSEPDVAASDEGFVVSWTSDYSLETDADGTSVQARRFTTSGASIGEQMQVNTETTGDQNRPAVAMDGDDGFTVVWRDESGTEALKGTTVLITGRRFNPPPPPPPRFGDFGLPNNLGVGSFGTAFTVTSAGLPDEPDVSDDLNGNFVVVWQATGSEDAEEIYGRRYNLALFTDGFESGDVSAWDAAVP